MANNNFVDYWDNVISAWLKCANGSNAATAFKSTAGLPINEKNAIDEQALIIGAINSNAGKKGTIYHIHPSHMPEPYWGNPDDCSIILLNYNPAGGSEISCYTSIECVGCSRVNNLTTFAKQNKYSGLALDFPLLMNDPKANGQGIPWIKNYGGYKWWQAKKKWLEHLACCFNSDGEENEKNNKMPFCIEVCGWHSVKWINNMKWASCQIKKIIAGRVILPILAAIQKNKTLTVCIGSQFSHNALCDLFCPYVDELIDCTSVINNSLDYPIEKGCIKVTVNDKNRYYRIYRIKYQGEYYYILNTWVQGSNRHPANHFWPEEEKIIRAIK